MMGARRMDKCCGLPVLMIDRRSWPVWAVVAVVLPLVVLDVSFQWGNTLKTAQGRMGAATIACQLMILWHTGEHTPSQMIRSQTISLERFETRLRARHPRGPCAR
jgi:K+ transporter